jgi:hypothetical protein
MHDLDRDGPTAEPLVVRQPDISRAARANTFDQLIPLSEIGHCYSPLFPPRHPKRGTSH